MFTCCLFIEGKVRHVRAKKVEIKGIKLVVTLIKLCKDVLNHLCHIILIGKFKFTTKSSAVCLSVYTTIEIYFLVKD